MQSVDKCILENYSLLGYKINDGWIHSTEYDCVRVRESLRSMGSHAVIKVDLLPPLTQIRFESNGFVNGNHEIGKIHLQAIDGSIQKTYTNAYRVISENGLDRFVIVFKTENEDEDTLISNEILPLTNRALGFFH
jgi:hypothetical protein